MFPPVGVGQIRVSHTHDLLLCNGKLMVPRSTLIWVPHHSMHNTIHNWDEPEKFLPGERLSCWWMHQAWGVSKLTQLCQFWMV